MKTTIHFQGLMRRGARLMLGVTLLAASLVAGSAMVLAAPAQAPAAAGPLTGVSCSPACDLYAVTGTMPAGSLPGAPAAGIPVWGYNTSNASISAPGGPTLIANEGDAITITLHNNDIPSATSLMIAGQPVVPDTTGITAGNSKTYVIQAGVLKAGTYLYEAGLTADGPRQAAMGLYGVLIVRPTGTPLQAYASTGTAFNDEAVLVLSEIDPVFNAAPATFEMSTYAPKYWLINGKVYPNTDTIATAAGNTVLLRYVNAGLQHHSMGLLGLHQTIIATNSQVATNPSKVVAETVPTGSTLDTLVAMPTNAPANSKYALFEAAMHEDNNGASTGGLINFGGMLAFLTMGGTPVTSAPVTSNVAVTPNLSNGSSPVTLSASVQAFTGTVSSAEYFIDTIGANGSGVPMAGTFGATSASVNAALSVAQLAALPSGNHTVYVHGQDSTGQWGAAASAVLNLDKAGPTVSNMLLTPNMTNGTADVQLQATASDAATGGQNVQSAEYTIDSGVATAIPIAMPTVNVSLNATIISTTVAGLSEGNHTIGVRARDSLGNWGVFGTITVTVDKTGPATSGVSTTPNPNNGTLGVQVGTGGGFSQRIDATVTDPVSGGINSNLVAAEYFFDTMGANGTGGAMFANDGMFNSPTEAVYGAVDLINIANLSQGNHTIYVHGKDAAGNWGVTSTTIFVIDKVAPTVSGVTLTPAASNNTAVAVSAAASDVATGNSNIAGGEFYIDTIGTAGTGTAMIASAAAPATSINGTIAAATVAALSAGNHTVYVRAKDAAGNWSTTTASATLLIDRTPPTFSSITLNPNSIPVGTASVSLTVNGATDPAPNSSGVVGGEYWFGMTNITAGTGTAFTGLTNVPIATGSLAAGTYTVRVRIRDAAGNWSTGTNGVRTATLTVTASVPDTIFSNGFETGTSPWGWSSASTGNATRLSVTTGAALVGTLGLQAQGNNTNYVQFNFGTVANPATATFDARFYFNPNNNASTGQDIFAAATTTGFGTQLFHVRYRRNGAQPQVQIQVGATANATWTNITNNASNRIEVVWQSGISLQLYVNGVLAQTIATASTGSVAAVRLGSVTTGGSATLEFFDAFASKRSVSPLIGP